jgi:hypothetical protein
MLQKNLLLQTHKNASLTNLCAYTKGFCTAKQILVLCNTKSLEIKLFCASVKGMCSPFSRKHTHTQLKHNNRKREDRERRDSHENFTTCAVGFTFFSVNIFAKPTKLTLYKLV